MNRKILQFRHVVKQKNILLFWGLFWYDAIINVMAFALAIQMWLLFAKAELNKWDGTSLQHAYTLNVQ